jgi:ribosomal protein S10
MNSLNSNLVITSVNKKLLSFYINFICKVLKSSNIAFKYFCFPLINKRLTILKSPHVNKKAKESFEIKKYKISFFFILSKYFLKEIK